MDDERKDQINIHPEGLTEAQETLAGLLFDTKTVAPVPRRRVLPDGKYEFFKFERPRAPIDFAQEGEFALKLHEVDPDAPLSPVYINLRNLPENILLQVGFVLAEMGGEEPDLCAGVPKAGIPLARAYSKCSGISIKDDVFGKEETGAGRKITIGASENSQGKTLRIIDDLASQGLTKIEAVRAAEQMGFKIVDVVVLVDRQQGAVQQLAELGYKLRAAFTIDQLLQYGVRTGRIREEQYKEVRQYLGLP